MKRLDRYLLGEMLLPFIGGILLIVVMLVGNTLFPLIQQIVKNGIPFKVVAKLVVFNIPTLIVLTLPAGMALSAAWAVNRLARDSEITVIRMAGVPLRRLFLPIFCIGIFASLLSFVINDHVVPRAQHEFQQTQEQMFAFAIQASPTVAENTVFSYQNYYFFVKEVHKDPSGDPNKLRLSQVTIFENAVANGFPIITTAQSATYNRDVWTLNNVVVHTIGADGFTQVEIAGKTTTLNLRVPLNNLAENAFRSPDELTMEQLGQQLQALRHTGQDATEVAVDYYMKLSLPFVCLAFALCAPPLALRFARTGAYTGIFLSIVMVWVAWNTLLLTKFLGLSGKMDPLIAAWSPDILFAVLGIYFLWKME
jgi:lipopolysaccharide export system permease protein